MASAPGQNKKKWRKDDPKPTQPILDRTPPCDISAEMAVLGSILLMPDVCDDLVMILRADDFYDDANRLLYSQMTSMVDSGLKIDVTLLVDRLKKADEYESIGGSGYLAKLANCVPNAAHAVYYAEIVRSKATFRKLIEASTSILRDCYDESHDAKELLSQAEQRVFQIQDERSSQAAESIGDLLTSAMERIDARMKGTHAVGGVDTHFAEYDAMSGGLHDGELVILAARPSMGKTAFALNVAENVALLGRAPVLFVSLEMSGIELADRLLCSVARVNGHQLRNGTISQDDRKRLVEKAVEISNAPLYVDDSPSRSVSEIAAVARRIKTREKNLGLIVIDYLQLIEPEDKNAPREQQIALISRRLKFLAKECSVPIIALAQLNRGVELREDKRPRLADLRESGSIEQDADLVMFLHRPAAYDPEDRPGEADVIIAKNRSGPTGNCTLAWMSESMRFGDLARVPDDIGTGF